MNNNNNNNINNYIGGGGGGSSNVDKADFYSVNTTSVPNPPPTHLHPPNCSL